VWEGGIEHDEIVSQCLGFRAIRAGILSLLVSRRDPRARQCRGRRSLSAGDRLPRRLRDGRREVHAVDGNPDHRSGDHDARRSVSSSDDSVAG
jgi:hypothetical protein